jgi:hypothetical protein
MDFGFSLQVRKYDGYVTAKFPDELTTSSARRRECVGVGDNRDRVEAAFAFADCFEDCDAFGANGQPVGCVFNVASAEDATGRGAKCGADAKVRVGGVRVFARLFRNANQMIEVGHAEIVSQTCGDDARKFNAQFLTGKSRVVKVSGQFEG